MQGLNYFLRTPLSTSSDPFVYQKKTKKKKSNSIQFTHNPCLLYKQPALNILCIQGVSLKGITQGKVMC